MNGQSFDPKTKDGIISSTEATKTNRNIGNINNNNNNVYAELVHAGFRPPKRTAAITKRKRYRFEDTSSVDDDENDNSDDGHNNNYRHNNGNFNDNSIYEDSDNDKKLPAAINVKENHTLRATKTRNKSYNTTTSIHSQNNNNNDDNDDDIIPDIIPSKPHQSVSTTATIKRSNKGMKYRKKHRVTTMVNDTTTQQQQQQQEQQQPFQLSHRLFEPIGGSGIVKRKKGRPLKIRKQDNDLDDINRSKKRKVYLKLKATSTNTKNYNNDNVNKKDTPITHSLQRGYVDQEIIQNNNDDGLENKGDSNNSINDVPTTNSTNAILPPSEPIIQLPPGSILRDSITHRILQKLNRLDTSLLMDHPCTSYRNDHKNKVDDTNTVKPVVDGSVTQKEFPSITEKSTSNSIDTDTSILLQNPVISDADNKNKQNGSHHNETESSILHERTSICMRSNVLPQITPTLPTIESYRVIVLHGTYKGRTGYIVDDIDGQFSVIRPDRINNNNNNDNSETWTVSNMALSTVSEVLEQQQNKEIGSTTLRSNTPIMKKKQPTRSEKNLFLQCLDKEYEKKRQIKLVAAAAAVAPTAPRAPTPPIPPPPDGIIWFGSAYSKKVPCRGWNRSDEEWQHKGYMVGSKSRHAHIYERCIRDDPTYRTEFCSQWDKSLGTSCGGKALVHCRYAHGPVELRVMEAKRNQWGKCVDENGNHKSDRKNSGGEDTYSAARAAAETKCQSPTESAAVAPIDKKNII